ncbi:MAG: NADP-dependent oxidoreductase [Rhodospirillales bacterium]|nr:NADP-dependent oxidoreductase [Rhodospirillales bacterium]
MKAIIMAEFGDVDVLTMEDVPKPEIGDGEILVEVKAIGINPIDYVARSVGGPLRGNLEKSLPVILGWDVAGIVSETNSDQFKIGDKVFALSRFPQIAGGYAEFASVPADQVALMPSNISFEEAAAVPLAALTAWQALVEAADLQSGQRVLIHAAAGGVGHFAVQIAKTLGAHVIGTASARNFDFLKSIGVDEAVDYTAQDVAEVVSDVDVVLHALPPDLREAVSWPCLKTGGILVSLLGPVPEEEAAKHNARGAQIGVRPDGAQLAEIGGLIGSGAIKITIDKTYPLAEIGAAHTQLASRHTRGKIVLTV